MSGEWITAETLALIRQRRAEGVGFASIAAEIGGGVTPNACIGAARRAGHPSKPLEREFVPWTPAEVAVLRANSRLLMAKLVALLPGRTRNGIQRKRNSLNLPGPPIGPPTWSRTAARHPPVRMVPLATVVAARTPPRRLPPVAIPEPAPVPLGGRGCQWIAGDPKLRGWKFCDAPRCEIGSPWCAEHRAACYTSVPPGSGARCSRSVRRQRC